MRQLSSGLLSQMLSQDSSDPFLTLLTISHSSFSTIYLVNNSEDITSDSQLYSAYGFNIGLAPEDGESQRSVQLTLDNTSLELIDEIRSVTTPISVNVQMVLASDPDQVQMQINDLEIKNIAYNSESLRCTLILDDFLNTELTSEKYGPQNFPGLF